MQPRELLTSCPCATLKRIGNEFAELCGVLCPWIGFVTHPIEHSSSLFGTGVGVLTKGYLLGIVFFQHSRSL